MNIHITIVIAIELAPQNIDSTKLNTYNANEVYLLPTISSLINKIT